MQACGVGQEVGEGLVDHDHAAGTHEGREDVECFQPPGGVVGPAEHDQVGLVGHRRRVQGEVGGRVALHLHHRHPGGPQRGLRER